MKRNLIIGIAILGVGGGLVFNVIQGNSKEIYVAGTATSTQETVVEVESIYPDEVVEASEEAKKAVLRAFELEQDRVRIVSEMEAKKAEYEAYVQEQSEVIDTIDKELKTY